MEKQDFGNENGKTRKSANERSRFCHDYVTREVTEITLLDQWQWKASHRETINKPQKTSLASIVIFLDTKLRKKLQLLHLKVKIHSTILLKCISTNILPCLPQMK